MQARAVVMMQRNVSLMAQVLVVIGEEPISTPDGLNLLVRRIRRELESSAHGRQNVSVRTTNPRSSPSLIASVSQAGFVS